MYDYLKLQPDNPIVMEEKLQDEKSERRVFPSWEMLDDND